MPDTVAFNAQAGLGRPTVILRRRKTDGITWWIGPIGFAVMGLVWARSASASGSHVDHPGSLIDILHSGALGTRALIAAFVGAFLWGAGHALTPGHGKAIVAAYLVGSRSTPAHAAWLGLTVTITHTLGVLGLGVVATMANRYVDPERVHPWLALVSGLMLAGLGVTLLVSRLQQLGGGHSHGHGHPHHQGHVHAHAHDQDDHSHSHVSPGTSDAPVTMRTLVALGVSGGLVPCPAALVLLLTAISIGRPALGLALVLAFSMGLAGVLTGVGILFVRGSRLMARLPRYPAIPRLLPVLSATVLVVVGAALTWEALSTL